MPWRRGCAACVWLHLAVPNMHSACVCGMGMPPAQAPSAARGQAPRALWRVRPLPYLSFSLPVALGRSAGACDWLPTIDAECCLMAGPLLPGHIPPEV